MIRRLSPRVFWLAFLLALAGGLASAEDGYELWLRYRPVANPATRGL